MACPLGPSVRVPTTKLPIRHLKLNVQRSAFQPPSPQPQRGDPTKPRATPWVLPIPHQRPSPPLCLTKTPTRIHKTNTPRKSPLPKPPLPKRRHPHPHPPILLLGDVRISNLVLDEKGIPKIIQSTLQAQRRLNSLRAHLPDMWNPGREELQAPLFQHPANIPNPHRLRPRVPLCLPLIPER